MTAFVHFGKKLWFDEFEHRSSNSYGSIVYCALPSCTLHLTSLDWASLHAVTPSFAPAGRDFPSHSWPAHTHLHPRGPSAVVLWLQLSWLCHRSSENQLWGCKMHSCHVFHKILWAMILVIPKNMRWLSAHSLELSKGVWTAAGWIKSCHNIVRCKILMESTAVCSWFITILFYFF